LGHTWHGGYRKAYAKFSELDIPATCAFGPPWMSCAARVNFTNGYWLLGEGVQARYPAQAYDVSVEADALVVFAPTEKIRHRGDTFNRPLLTVRCSSPAPDVISVAISHFVGE
jgi:hypothetical protein